MSNDPKTDREKTWPSTKLASAFLALTQFALQAPFPASAAEPCAPDSLIDSLSANLGQPHPVAEEPPVRLARGSIPDSVANETLDVAAVQASPEKRQAFANEVNRYVPSLKWDLRSGKAETDLSYVNRRLLPWLKAENFKPDEVSLLVDGDFRHEIKIPMDRFNDPNQQVLADYFIGHNYHQTDLHIIIRGKDPAGKQVTLYTSSWQMLPDENFAHVDAASFANTPVAGQGLPPEYMRQTGREPNVDAVALASKRLKNLHQVAVNPDSTSSTAKDVIARFQDHGAQLKFERVLGKDGKLVAWKVTDNVKHDQIVVSPEDLLAVGNAGFNSNLFQWDGHFWALGEVPTNPAGAKDWLQFVMLVQKMNGTGGLPRETRNWNMIGLQLPREVKLDTHGHPFEVANTQYANPPLWGMVARELYRVDPQGMKPMLPEIIHSLEWHRQWWRDQLGKFDQDGKLLGFKWSNLGSGRDNAPRCLDHDGCLAVDAITYYKMMLDQEEEFYRALGQTDTANATKKEADEVAKTINDHYWNAKLGMYSDINQHANGQIEQSNIRTMAGFWPMMARTANPAQLDSMINGNLLNPDHFGGVPMPFSVARSHAGQVDEHGHPIFDPAGSYWRGGPWIGPDGRMTTEALHQNGYRAEAANQHANYMGGMTQATQYQRLGDTPARLNGKTLTPEELANFANNPLTMWESFGYQPVDYMNNALAPMHGGNPAQVPKVAQPPGYSAGNQGLAMTFNHERIGGAPGAAVDAKWHNTREGLAWTAQTAQQGIKMEFGKYETPPFFGADTPESSAARVAELLKLPIYQNHFFAEQPSLRPLADKLKGMSQPEVAVEILKRMKASDQFAREMKNIRNGYIELAPPFDPGQNVSYLMNQSYDGVRYNLRVDRVGADKVQITMQQPDNQNSFKPLPLQFNRLWKGSGTDAVAVDKPLASSDVMMIGDAKDGRQKPVTLPDGTQGWQVTLDLSSSH